MSKTQVKMFAFALLTCAGNLAYAGRAAAETACDENACNSFCADSYGCQARGCDKCRCTNVDGHGQWECRQTR